MTSDRKLKWARNEGTSPKSTPQPQVTDTEDIKTLDGHDGGVKSFCFNPAYLV